MTNMFRRHTRQKNNWKRLFYGLFLLNFLVIITIITVIFWPLSNVDIPLSDEVDTKSSSEFSVQTTKENLNELVNAYIEKLQHGTKHKYSISLEEDVHLLGELPIFSTTVPLSVHLDPFVQDNGDVILKQKSISIGLLELPNKKIMEYIDKYLPMPEWVTVIPKDEEIYVAVSDMNIKSNFKVSVEKFDLQSNDLALRINIPYKTLGIDLIED